MGNTVKYYIRGRRPQGFWGRRALLSMNSKHHAAMPEWVLSELDIKEDDTILDVGCGGGANIARLLKRVPKGKVIGLDYSQLALEIAQDYNYRDYVDKRCLLMGGNAMQMPLAKETYGMITAFETIYYWLSLELGFSEIHRLLKPGGTIVIGNELDGTQEIDRKIERATNYMRIYNIDEIETHLKQVGFTNIKSRHDEERHFVCVTATK